jgi:phage shock protein PspC (stress-responsive transcriptional regulator)
MDIIIGTLVISLMAFLVLITWVVIWIFTLVYQGERKQWVWFVLTLIFNIVLLIYWIVWLFEPKLKRKRK